MKRRMYRRPDPLFLLAVIVALGVVVTTAAKGAEPGLLGSAAAQLDRLEVRWADGLVGQGGLRDFVRHRGLEFQSGRDTRLGLRFGRVHRPGPALYQDMGPGVGAPRPSVSFSIRHRW